jgi:hypothetical protein
MVMRLLMEPMVTTGAGAADTRAVERASVAAGLVPMAREIGKADAWRLI